MNTQLLVSGLAEQPCLSQLLALCSLRTSGLWFRGVRACHQLLALCRLLTSGLCSFFNVCRHKAPGFKQFLTSGLEVGCSELQQLPEFQNHITKLERVQELILAELLASRLHHVAHPLGLHVALVICAGHECSPESSNNLIAMTRRLDSRCHHARDCKSTQKAGPLWLGFLVVFCSFHAVASGCKYMQVASRLPLDQQHRCLLIAI